MTHKETFTSCWTSNSIIDKLTTAPVLGFANPKLFYVPQTDASTMGLGDALYQEQDRKQIVIATASCGL